MKIARFLGSQAHAIYALAAVFLGAVALAALGSFVPDQALSAWRSLIPGATPFLQLLLLGWMGVVLGRVTITPAPVPVESSKPAATARRRTMVILTMATASWAVPAGLLYGLSRIFL